MLFRVAITLIKLHEVELSNCTDFGEMAETYKKIARTSSVLDCHYFMAVLYLHYFSPIILPNSSNSSNSSITIILLSIVSFLQYLRFTRP